MQAPAHHNVPPDPDLDQKVKKATEKISENLHIVANEPSLALYRLQEHIRKSMPQLVEKRLEVNRMYHDLQGKCYDAEYSVHAVRCMHTSGKHFQNIQDLLKNSIFIKQQLTYEENRKAGVTTRPDRKSQQSMYQRLSSISLDLPDLPDALRPVASVLSASTFDPRPSQFSAQNSAKSSKDVVPNRDR